MTRKVTVANFEFPEACMVWLELSNTIGGWLGGCIWGWL